MSDTMAKAMIFGENSLGYGLREAKFREVVISKCGSRPHRSATIGSGLICDGEVRKLIWKIVLRAEVLKGRFSVGAKSKRKIRVKRSFPVKSMPHSSGVFV
jgi:hypothetical protein